MESFLAAVLADTEENGCSESLWVDMCTETDQMTLTSDPNFDPNIDIDREIVSVKVPEFYYDEEDENPEEICAALRMEQTWKDNLADIDDGADLLKWQYYGSQQKGSFSIYPGYEWDQGDDPECSPTWDPRFRPWYAAAASGPKNVIVIIDVSGSMAEGSKWQMTKDAASAVMKTLTHADYFGFVAFSDLAESWQDTLVPATDANKADAQTWIDGLLTLGGTNMDSGFVAAFDIFDASADSNSTNGCNDAILFLTDGQNTGENPVDTTLARNQGAIVFTYVLGNGVSKSVPRALACENRGVMQVVDDGDAEGLATAMASYYTYFATAIDSSVVTWSEIYEFSSGGRGISGTRPVYDRTDGGSGRLFGVLGIDYFIESLTDTGATEQQINEYLRLRSQASCPETIEFDEDTLSGLRDHHCLTTNQVVFMVLGAVGASCLLCIVGGWACSAMSASSNSGPAPPSSFGQSAPPPGSYNPSAPAYNQEPPAYPSYN